MSMLSEDDLDLAELSDAELAAAWDLWFDLAQATNDGDPAWTHGAFLGVADARPAAPEEALRASPQAAPEPPDSRSSSDDQP